MIIKQTLVNKLTTEFSPLHLEVINESDMHNVPKGSESHFKVVIVTEKFEGLRLVGRHRLVYGLLAEELTESVHALALHTYTPEQWESLNIPQVPKSPNCMGG